MEDYVTRFNEGRLAHLEKHFPPPDKHFWILVTLDGTQTLGAENLRPCLVYDGETRHQCVWDSGEGNLLMCGNTSPDSQALKLLALATSWCLAAGVEEFGS